MDIIFFKSTPIYFSYTSSRLEPRAAHIINLGVGKTSEKYWHQNQVLVFLLPADSSMMTWSSASSTARDRLPRCFLSSLVRRSLMKKKRCVGDAHARWKCGEKNVTHLFRADRSPKNHLALPICHIGLLELSGCDEMMRAERERKKKVCSS